MKKSSPVAGLNSNMKPDHTYYLENYDDDENLKNDRGHWVCESLQSKDALGFEILVVRVLLE